MSTPAATEVDELDRQLAATSSEDYWSDLGLDDAIQVVARFVDADWTQLAALAADRPAAWQTRCADVLGDVADGRAVPLLDVLLGSAEPPVMMAALESVRMRLGQGAEVPPEPSIRAAIARMRPVAGRVETLALADLERRLQP